MRRLATFVALLVLGLALLGVGGFLALGRVTDAWFDKDLRLRSELAVRAATRGLAASWRPGATELRETLEDITHDERIMGASACGADGQTMASTPGYPDAFSCKAVLAHLGPETGDLRTMRGELPSGPVHVSAVRLEGTNDKTVLLLHDLAFVSRREATAGRYVAVAFLVLALAASLLTVLSARLFYRSFVVELRRALAGKGDAGTFEPLVQDLRRLAARLVDERGQEVRHGAWTPERLRAALRQHLEGDRVVVLANREPYIHERRASGAIEVVHPASGLVTALEPVMRACSGVWIAHGSGSADRETVDARDHVKVPPGEESYEVRRVWLSPDDEKGYYYGFSNEGLWPLCHVAHTRPEFRTSDWERYVAVNQKFADAVCEEVDTDDPIILVQDYHFALAPRMIRAKLPRATILTFWHIPWPNAERIGICPWREELLQGLLGSSIVGFHTEQFCNNFIDSVDTYLESRIDRASRAVVQGDRRSLVRAYPISIEWPVHWLDGIASVEDCRREIREELGLAPDTWVGVGVDRLDYTKGIEERLLAVDDALERHPELRGRFVFIQLAAPSRTVIERYRELNQRVEALAERVNAKWAGHGQPPIVLLRRHHEPEAVFRFYRAADLCYVSSLHDGMNLVAKEFVAARDDEAGVLVLSQLTGAARELTEALVVNPYDVRRAGDALAAAIHMHKSEQAVRMRSMRRLVASFNVYRWAGRMIADAAEVRRRERLSGRLEAWPSAAPEVLGGAS
jgi:trehalose 6-phosphate synthase